MIPLALYPITLAAAGLTACVVTLLANRAEFGTLWSTLEALARPRRYAGSHRSAGRATWRHVLASRARTARSRAARAAYLALMVVPRTPDPDWVDELRDTWQFGDVDEFDRREEGGAQAYDRLPWVLDGPITQEFRALTAPAQWGAPVEVDEWAEPELAAHRG